MLSQIEKIIFIVLFLFAVFAALRISLRILRIVGRGHGNVDWSVIPQRILAVIGKTISSQPVFRLRLIPSLFHAFIGWAFIFYILVNLFDVLEGLFSGFDLLSSGTTGNFYRLIADLLSVAAIVGMVALIIRRFIIKPDNLSARQDVLISEKARRGILRDSAIVAGFILLHVGSRFIGQTFSKPQ